MDCSAIPFSCALTREKKRYSGENHENCNHLHRWCVLGQSGTRRLGCDPAVRQGGKELSGSEPSTTNNRMELLGVITALEILKEPCSVDLYSDSKYVVDGITKGWAKGWRARGWVKSDKKPAKIRNSGGVCSICWINTRCGSIGSRVTRIIRITTAVTSLPSASIRSINKKQHLLHEM